MASPRGSMTEVRASGSVLGLSALLVLGSVGCPVPGSEAPLGAASGPASSPASAPASRPASAPAAVAQAAPHAAPHAAVWTAVAPSGVRCRLGPRSGGVTIGRLQAWTAELSTPDGAPLYPARLALVGGMQAHGHGLPTRPLTTGYEGGGRYAIDGVTLNMAGAWQLELRIAGPDQREHRCRFEIEVDTDAQARILASMRRPASLPPSPTNRVADDPRGVEFGRRLFFDRGTSGPDGRFSCASCHDPARGFTDGRKVGQGAAKGGRNTMTVLGAAYQRWFYWDGRRDSLWAQALLPFEAPSEMAGSRVYLVQYVVRQPDLRARYEALFGELPSASWLAALPADANPYGEASARERWHRIAEPKKRVINTIFANVGKAIAAYERTLVPPRTRFDDYLDAVTGDSVETGTAALSALERRGLNLFLSERTRCLRCHNGPMLSNGGFHNLGTGTDGDALDFGRAMGARAVALDEFNCLGPYSDGAKSACVLRFASSEGQLQGAFKVPTLRGIKTTAPYFHDGRFATLQEVVRFYNRAAPVEDGVSVAPLELSDEDVAALVAFLSVL